MPPRLTEADASFPYSIDRLAGSGQSSGVWLAKGPDGQLVALKIGHAEAERGRLADEATRLIFAASGALPRLLDAGLMPASRCAALGLPPRVPYLALEWIDGRAIEPRELDASDRRALALAVGRDVAEALRDLHAAGLAHGDVKPGNVLASDDASRATLVDLGLAFVAAEALVRGGSWRYLAPECLAPGKTRHGAPRDLYALGLSVAEIASVEVAEADAPAEAARRVELGEDVESIVRPLLQESPAARPGADWVQRRASAALNPDGDVTRSPQQTRAGLERAYLAAQRRPLEAVARGARVQIEVGGQPGDWVERACRLLRRVAEVRGAARNGTTARIDNLLALGRQRLLLRWLGPAARYSAVDARDDAELVERLEAMTAASSHDHLRERRAGDGVAGAASGDPVALAVALAESSPSPDVLERAERRLRRHPQEVALGLQLATALRLQEQLGRALAVLDRLDGSEARVESAELARRAGDVEDARRRLSDLDLDSEPDPVRARAAATLARIDLLDAGAERALERLERAPRALCTLEARAMARVRQGELDLADQDLLAARPLARRAEERARLEFLSGRVAHGRHDYAAALDAFARAAEFAVQGGALLEEATYLAGVAASATELGSISQALGAAARSMLLYEALGRPNHAARAALSRAGALLAVGAREESLEAASEAARLAREGGDRRCEAYAHLSMAEASRERRRTARDHLERARSLLDPTVDDRLRLEALRLLVDPDAPFDDAGTFATDPGASPEARLAFWGARARQNLEQPERRASDSRVVSELSRLVSSRASVGVRGPAFAAGAELAARNADGEVSRRFAEIARDAASTLRRNAPDELEARLAREAWAAGVADADAFAVSPEQIRDVDTLVRSLTTRQGLRPLLAQVLDALVLWTGVERGLLLLTAPGDRLVVRAARNLAREDLDGAQLELSYSIARRAIATRQPVVAVDAVGELPEHHESVHALKLRSLLAIPLFSRGETLGVVYLDDRVRTGAFGPRELSWVRLVASIASVAIGDARDQLELRRAVRRAKRAERKLETALVESQERLQVAERELADRSVERRAGYEHIVGDSHAMTQLITLVDRVAHADVPVLVLGESGTGKELVARAIHDQGSRRGRAFVSENCSAIPEPLLESTLFGHVRGAFTGASRTRAGLFSIAHDGTLFLDEIGDMSLSMQAKLLRVLQTGEVRPLGSEKSQRVDVRIVGATGQNLDEMVAQGTFREDLYYRLNVVSIRVPTLRERREDVAPLARHFIAEHAEGKETTLTPEAIACLEAYRWPGNVRELENEMRRALVMAGTTIEPQHLSPRVQGQRAPLDAGHGLHVRRRIDELENELVREALTKTQGNQTRAAELLGLSRFGLQKMMKRLHISKADL